MDDMASPTPDNDKEEMLRLLGLFVAGGFGLMLIRSPKMQELFVSYILGAKSFVVWTVAITITAIFFLIAYVARRFLQSEDRLAIVRVPHEIHTLDLRNPAKPRRKVMRKMVVERLFDANGRENVEPDMVIQKKRVLLSHHSDADKKKKEEEMMRENGFEDAFKDYLHLGQGGVAAPNCSKKRSKNDGSSLEVL